MVDGHTVGSVGTAAGLAAGVVAASLASFAGPTDKVDHS